MVTIPEKTLAHKNNNPGNLRFAGQRGASQGVGGFARFESPEAGWSAMLAQVDLDSRRGHTVDSFINKYAPPVENDTNHYLDFVTKEAGIDRGAKLADVDRRKLAKAMAKLESGTIVDPKVALAEQETGEPQVTEEAPIPEQPKPGLTLENLDQLLNDGVIGPEEANDFLTREELKGNLLDMTSDGIEDALMKGYVTEDQVDAWADFQEHPVWFRVKDVAKAPIKGIEKMVESAANAVNELLVIDGLVGRAEIPDVIGDTHTIGGKVVEGIAQVAIPYAGALKGLAVAGTVNRVMQAPRMVQLAASSPRLAVLAESLIKGTMAGAAADYVAFDPYEGRAVDILEEYGVLPEVLDFLTTDDNDPAPIGRLKNVLEGAMVGGAFEVIFAGIKGLKAGLVRKHMGNIEAVAEEAINANPKLAKVYKEIGEKQALEAETLRKELLGKNAEGLKVLRDELKAKESLTAGEQARLDFYEKKLDEIDPHAKFDEVPGKPQEEIASPEGSQRVDKPEGNQAVGEATGQPTDIPKKPGTLKKGDRNLEAVKILRKQKDGSEPVFSDKLTDDIESFVDGNNKNAADLMRHIYEEAAPTIDAARKLGTTNKETEGSATKLLKETAKLHGKDEKSTFASLRSMVGSVFTDMQDMTTKVRAMNRFFVNYATSVDRLIDNSRSFQDKLKALEHIKFLEEMQAMVYGVRSESGRLLQSYNMKWQKGRFDFQNLPTEGLEDIRMTSEARIDEALKHYRKAKTTGQKMCRARNLGRNRLLGGLLEYVQLNLLYNPVTQAVNILSQTGTYAWKTMHRSLAIGWDATINGNPKALQELTAWAEGTKAGLTDAFRLVRRTDKKAISLAKHIEQDPEVGKFWKAMWTGDSYTDPLKKLEGEGSESYFAHMLQKAPGALQPIGKLLRWPFHGLTAFDEAFKNVGYHAELHSNLLREGWSRGLNGQDLDLWMQSALKEPPVAVHFEALRSAREMTFQDPLDKFAGGLEKALNSGNVGLTTRILAAPFFKITVNMMKYAGRNSVFAPASRQWRKEWTAGGIKRYEAVSRMLTGTAIMAVSERMYASGVITGRCPEPLRELWQAEGRQEYSVKIGGQWYSYKRLEPLATLIGLAADMHMAVDYLDLYDQDQIDSKELFWAMMATVTSPVTSKTWMTSMEELLGLVAGHSNMNAEKFALRQAEKFVPGSAGLSQAQTTFNDDPLVREMRNASDLFWKKVDTTKMSPRQHSIYGTDLIKEPAALGLFMTKAPAADPVIAEMVNIKCNVERPEDRFTPWGAPPGVSVKMTDEQYIRYNQIIAELPMRESLNYIINHPDYLAVRDPDTRSKILKGQISNIREIARRRLVGENIGDIQTDIQTKIREKAEAIIGIHTTQDPAEKLYKYRALMK